MRYGRRELPADSGSLATIGRWSYWRRERLMGFFWEIKKKKIKK